MMRWGQGQQLLLLPMRIQGQGHRPMQLPPVPMHMHALAYLNTQRADAPTRAPAGPLYPCCFGTPLTPCCLHGWPLHHRLRSPAGPAPCRAATTAAAWVAGLLPQGPCSTPRRVWLPQARLCLLPQRMVAAARAPSPTPPSVPAQVGEPAVSCRLSQGSRLCQRVLNSACKCVRTLHHAFPRPPPLLLLFKVLVVVSRVAATVRRPTCCHAETDPQAMT